MLHRVDTIYDVDIAIYLMGLSEMIGFDLEEQILNKVSKNEKRVYKNIDVVNIRISDEND